MAETGTDVTRPASGRRGVLALAVLGALCGFLLASVHAVTTPLIAANERARLKRLLQLAMPEADAYQVVRRGGIDFYVGTRAGEVIAAVVPGEAMGYSGEPIKILALVSPGGEIREIVVARHRETPGIGDRIGEPLFLAQFQGVFEDLVTVRHKGERELEDILVARVDVITGATISCRAVVRGVAQAVHVFTALQ